MLWLLLAIVLIGAAAAIRAVFSLDADSTVARAASAADPVTTLTQAQVLETARRNNPGFAEFAANRAAAGARLDSINMLADPRRGVTAVCHGSRGYRRVLGPAAGAPRMAGGGF